MGPKRFWDFRETGLWSPVYLQCTLRQPVLTVQRNLQFGLVELVCNVQLSLIILVHNVNCAFFVYKCTIYNAEESILQSTAMKTKCIFRRILQTVNNCACTCILWEGTKTDRTMQITMLFTEIHKRIPSILFAITIQGMFSL